MQRRKRLTYVLLAIALASPVVWSLLPNRASVRVSTATVTNGPVTREILAAGTLEPTTTVEVSAQVTGTITSLNADFNSIVHKGEVLARLDTSALEAQLDLAQAALTQARADEDGLEAAAHEAEVELTREKALSATQVVPEADLEEARLASEAAQAGVKDGQSSVTRANAVVHEMSVNVDHATIRSPIDGFVVARNVDVGQTLVSTMQAQPLFRIAADLKRMEVLVDIDQSDVAQLKKGKPALFRVASYPNQIFHGTVRILRLEPIVAQAAVVSYTAVVDVDNANELLRPGMTAEVTFDGPTRDASIRIPNNALSFRPSTDVLRRFGSAPSPVHVAGSSAPQDQTTRVVWEYDGRLLTPVTVHTGLTDDAWTELVSGPLRAGDLLVTGAALQHPPS